MARNNDLVVTAGLNIEASVAQIEKDLKQVNDRLSADHALKIIANVDLSKTTQRIQSQLTTLSKNLKLDIGGINTSNISQSIDSVVSDIQNRTSKGFKLNWSINDYNSEVEKLKHRLSDLGANSKYIEELEQRLNKLNITVSKVSPSFTRLSDTGRQMLTTLTVTGKDAFGNTIKYIENFDKKSGKFKQATTQIVESYEKVQKAQAKIEDSAKAAQLAYNDFLKLKGQADVYSKRFAGEDSLKTQLADIQQLVSDFDNTQPLEKQRESIILIDNELKKLKVDIDAIKGSTDKNTGSIEDWHRKQNLLLQDYDILAAKIKKANLDINQVATRDGVNYNEIFNNLMGGDITNSGDLSKARDAVAAIRKEFQLLNAQMVSDLPQNVIENLIQGMNKADSQIKVLTVDYEKLENPSQELIQSFEKLRSLAGNFDFSTDFEGETKESIEKKIKDYTQIKVALSDTQSALKAFQKEEKKAFQEDNRLANLQNRIKRLTADVNAYGEANERATKSMRQMSNGKTFAVEWSRIIAEMSKGVDLTDRELEDLSADMAVFRKEAQAAGLAGESAFGKFANSFKVMSSYITANMVFNFVKRQLRDMVQEVTAVDTAMVELRKVTEATDEQFEAFAKSAGQTGRELGASISDVINATATFSRAGFNLPDAEELGKVATLYKNVGDGITIDAASESIISVMKAFNIEAENSIGIIDRINEVSNRAAIDSGGLGLALQRVASAMDAANNSLDETIALTTVSNEIVQNPEMVAQGWRTVALRIRGAKSELEDAGLETEGMVESTAKLRDLIKGISGVDIMLDENTFKSTYQIIEELGKVWNNINDVNQASLLEAIAGKRQSNIVAAALNNYERLNEVLEISESSAGSAMREQEEYAKSIQYSIDTLKASYQGFSQTVINSDFVKTLLGSAQEFLEVLTAIIDKFGTFPTLLASVGAVGSFNKMGFFKVVEDDAIKGGNAITLFGKRLKDIIKDYKEADAGRIGENKISQAFSGIIGFNQSDLSAIEKYNSLIESGVDKTEAFEKSMVGASNGAKSFVQSGKTATVGITGLSISEKAATVATEALGVALNMALSFGIGLLIQAIITGITKLINAEKEAREKAEELRREATETAKSYKDKVESLSNLTAEYIKLATTTSDLTTQKEKLLGIQDKINDGFVSEKEKIDLLNGSLSENLRLLDEQEYKEAKRAISDLEPRYEEFQNLSNKEGNYFLLNEVDKKRAKDVAKNIEREFVDFFNATTDYYEAEWVDAFTGEQKSAYVNVLSLRQPLNEISIAGQSYAEVLENLDLIISSYREWEGHNNDTLESLNALRSKYDELAQSENEVTTAYEAAQKSIQDYNNAFNSDASQRISEILEDAKELSTTLNSSTSETEKYNAVQQLSDLEKEARQLAGANTVLKNNVDVVFNAINAGSQSSIKSIGDLRSAWFESLEDIQKNTISNIDKMDKALKTVVSGNNLSSSDFWELAKLDADNIIRSISLVNGEYKLSQQELVNLKDQYIQKQIESLKVTQAQIKADEEEARQALIVAKRKLADIGSFDTAKRGSANLNNPAYRAYLDRQKEANSEIEKAESNIKELGDEQARNNVLLREYNSRLGFSVEQTKALAETYKKNFTDAIDKQINKVNDRKQALEDEKAVLNEQLEVLEEQQKALEETIEQYKTVSNVIKKAIDEETDAFKEQQKAEEDAVQARIDALKKSREAKEEEAELAEKQLAVQEKLRDLEKARNNKVRTYSSDRGWHYEADKEAVANAETAYSDARKAYDEFIEKRSYESQLKALESEKDLISKNYEGMIQAYEDYYTEYEKILNEQTDAENEQLANQILGADWRERIKSRDTDTLNKFKANFNSYNSQLKNLVNGEIATLKNSIKAKDEQIKALDKEIDAWNRYKNNLKNSIDEIDSKYEDMQNGLDGLEYSNDLSLSNIESRMWDFKENYKAYMDEAISKARELRDASSEGIDTSAIDSLAERIEKIKGEVNDAIDAMSEKSIFLGGRASATKTHASLITPQFYDLATAPVISNAINKPNVNETNRVININELTIKADNPKQFHDQFEKEMGQYWKIKLTENYVK